MLLILLFALVFCCDLYAFIHYLDINSAGLATTTFFALLWSGFLTFAAMVTYFAPNKTRH